MVMIPLTAGAYSAQSLTANAQRCINLYLERNPEDTTPATPTSHYPRPGLKLLSRPPVAGPARCLYPANDGSLYGVIGQTAYYIDPNFNFNFIGTLVTPGTTPVYMADNGTTAVIVDGSSNGYQITLAGHAFAPITDANFLGSVSADFLDSFIVFNKPNSRTWYCTTANTVQFNALFFGTKTAWPDDIIRIITCERLVWLLGSKKSEVWFNAGASPFPFQLQSGVIIEQGCAAPYSVAKMDTNVYWLNQSPEGDRMVVRANLNLTAQRISTHAIEVEWRTYPVVSDAIGSTYQVSGHAFYCLTFPTADKTWVFDEATQQWHEDNWIDSNGALHRSRNTYNAFSYSKNLALDWNNGSLYQVDPQTMTDQYMDANNTLQNNPIPIIRAFPHILNELKYISYSEFTANVATGLSVNTDENQIFGSPWSPGYSSGFGPITGLPGPVLAFRFSRDGGYNFDNMRFKKLVSSGHYRSMQRFRALGLGRDGVAELSSTAQMISAINAAYIDVLQGGA